MSSPAGVVRSALSALDRYQRRHTWVAFPVAVAKKFGEDGAGGLAGLIAYYGFFAVFPLLLVFVTVLSFVLHGDPALQSRIVSDAKHQFPSLSGYLEVGSIAGSGIALAAGLLFALWAGLGVTSAAQRAMNSVWDVPVTMQPDFWRVRLRGLGLLALLGTATVVSTGASALRGVGGPLAGVFNVVGIAAPLALNIGLYLVAFQVLTVVHLTWRQVLPGALLGAVLWTALQVLGGYYTRHTVAHASHLYGTFAVVIGLLAWIHLGAQVTIYAAEMNVVWTRRLWPRSIGGGELTDADRRAFQSQRAEHDRLSDEGAAWRSDAPEERRGADDGPRGGSPPEDPDYSRQRTTSTKREGARVGASVEFASNGGTVGGYLALPESGRGPGLVVVQEWWGLDTSLKTMVDRLAESGFVALAPDLYRGELAGHQEVDKASHLMQTLPADRAARDMSGAVDYLHTHAAVSGKGIGVVGFCMGGMLALHLAALRPDLVVAAVPFYGFPQGDQEPDWEPMTAAVRGHMAERDDFFPPGAARSLEAKLQGLGKDVVFTIHPAGHAFMNPEDALGTSDPELADRLWPGAVAFLHERLDA